MDEKISQEQNLVEKGGSQTDLRRYNERIVLAALDRHPGLFNAELARRTGLAAQTISVILRALDGQGLIARGQALRGRRGQPATPLFLKPDAAYGIGAALCWRGLSLGLTDLSGTVLDTHRERYGFPDFDDVIARIAVAAERFRGQLPEGGKARVAGVGLALPAAMDRCLHALGASGEAVRHWQNRDFCAELSTAVGLPVWPIGYGAAAAGAQARQGEAGRNEDFAYFFLGTFLMGGIVLGGSFATARPSGAMLGAMVVPGPDGASRSADEIVSMRGLEMALRAAGVDDPGRIDPESDWRAVAGPVEAWLDEAAAALAHVAVNTRCAFELDTIVVDGMLPGDLLALLIERTEAAISAVPHAAAGRPVLVQGQLGPRAAMAGAARLPFHQRFFNTDATV